MSRANTMGPDAAATVEHFRRSILDDLELDVELSQDELEFWNAVGSFASLPTATDPLVAATSLFEAIDEEWNDDYDLEGALTIATYEALMNHVSSNLDDNLPPLQVRGEADEDEDEANRVARKGRVNVRPERPTLDSLMLAIKKGSINVSPSWQREYVWTSQKKRKLIESVLLDIPMPSILLYEDENRVRHVIDGRQRLETLHRFWNSEDKANRFKTPGKTVEGWKEGQALEDSAGKLFHTLPEKQQRVFEQYSVETLTFRELPKSSLYEIFKRYNTGSEKLKAQEIRNAVFQESQLHQMMHRLAGEHQDVDAYADDDERRIGEELRSVMGSKKRRFGPYNFIGRVLAFSHEKSGTVATAINDFMEHWDESGNLALVEQYRQEFIQAYDKVCLWYDEPFCVTVKSKTPFHELIATIQMASTIQVLSDIDAGLVTEEQVQATIGREWTDFVYGTQDSQTGELDGGVLQAKQNTTTHWGKQKDWLNRLRGEISQPVSATTYAS